MSKRWASPTVLGCRVSFPAACCARARRPTWPTRPSCTLHVQRRAASASGASVHPANRNMMALQARQWKQRLVCSPPPPPFPSRHIPRPHDARGRRTQRLTAVRRHCGGRQGRFRRRSRAPPILFAGAAAHWLLAYGAALGVAHAAVHLFRADNVLRYPILHQSRYERAAARLRAGKTQVILCAAAATVASASLAHAHGASLGCLCRPAMHGGTAATPTLRCCCRRASSLLSARDVVVRPPATVRPPPSRLPDPLCPAAWGRLQLCIGQLSCPAAHWRPCCQPHWFCRWARREVWWP